MKTGVEVSSDINEWILASASPRRQSLITQLGIFPQAIAAEIEEIAQPHESPSHFAERMAVEKALAVAHEARGARFVIGGDTVVALGQRILGKPTSRDDAQEMLDQLSGQSHDVWSGWAIVEKCKAQVNILQSGVSRSKVLMRDLTLGEIESYVASGEPMDKAGSYGIQGLGGRFVTHLEGSLYSVIGLPLIELMNALKPFDTHRDWTLTERGIRLRERVATAAWRSGRPIDQVNVLAVSKKHSLESMIEAARHGFCDFGESYLNELIEKRPSFEHERTSSLTQSWASGTYSWHFIGALQTNKAKRIGSLADWVHGLSRLEEAEKLSQGAMAKGHQLKSFIQVNLSGEESKGGIDPDQTLKLLEDCRGLPHLSICGLMTFPPLATPEESRPHFRALARLRDELQGEGYSIPELSMGTSDDFEVAIEEGATWIRPGRGLFGDRR